MDRSQMEMAAVHLLALSGDALCKLLYRFPLLRELQRLLIYGKAGVSREDKNCILVVLKQLMHFGNEQLSKHLMMQCD